MPLPVSTQVGPQGPLTPGNTPILRTGPTGELIENQMFGKYYEATRLGLVFTAANAVAGAAVPQATSTTQQFVLFNPPASAKRAILIKTTLGYVSTTMTAGCFTYSVNASTANAVTGTPLTINNNLNGGSGIVPGASSMQAFSGATVVAMTLLRPAKYSEVVMAATATNAPWQFDEDLDGSIVIAPGGAFAIGGNITLGVTVIASVTWIELPSAAGT